MAKQRTTWKTSFSHEVQPHSPAPAYETPTSHPSAQLLLTGNQQELRSQGLGKALDIAWQVEVTHLGGVRIQETAWGGGVSEQKRGDSVTWEGSDLP